VLKERETGGAYVVAALLRTFPLTGTVVLLILTRIEQIGLKVGSARVWEVAPMSALSLSALLHYSRMDVASQNIVFKCSFPLMHPARM
jgi:hypothetical protein